MKFIKFRYILVFMSEVPKHDIFSNHQWSEKIQSTHVGKYAGMWQSTNQLMQTYLWSPREGIFRSEEHLVDIKQPCPQEKPLTEKVPSVLNCGLLILNQKAGKGNPFPVLGECIIFKKLVWT